MQKPNLIFSDQKLAQPIKNAMFLWILFAVFDMIFVGLVAASESQSAEPFYSAKGKRDPFVPLVTLSSREPASLIGVQNANEVMLEGVIYDPNGQSLALISGSLLKEGQQLGGIKVVKVKPNGVQVSINGVESFKPLYTEKDDKPKPTKKEATKKYAAPAKK